LSNRNRKKERVHCRSRNTSRSSINQCRFCLRPRGGKNIFRKPLRRKPWLSGSTSNSQRKLTAAIKAVLALCEAARGKGSAAVSATGHKGQSTDEEEKAEKALVALIREFQARARQKHFSKNPATLAEYGIGLKIANSRALLEGWGQTIHDKTATDKLPKITEAKRSALKAALQTYKDTQTGQTGAIGQASGTRLDRNALVEQATERRLWLQFAADAEWPHTNPANTPIRREFQLPATRAFVG
jgi:hypothetical protein